VVVVDLVVKVETEHPQLGVLVELEPKFPQHSEIQRLNHHHRPAVVD
jgi:hypothetical protein